MITTRKKQSFGIAAVELGAPVSTVPSIPVNLNEWEHAVLMDTFYSAGGRETVSSTNLRMMWDQKNLYLYLICYEKEARVSRPSDENVLKTEWMLRKDKIEIALSSGKFWRARLRSILCRHRETGGSQDGKGNDLFRWR